LTKILARGDPYRLLSRALGTGRLVRRRLGKTTEAIAAYQLALCLSNLEPERLFLEAQVTGNYRRVHLIALNVLLSVHAAIVSALTGFNIPQLRFLLMLLVVGMILPAYSSTSISNPPKTIRLPSNGMGLFSGSKLGSAITFAMPSSSLFSTARVSRKTPQFHPSGI